MIHTVLKKFNSLLVDLIVTQIKDFRNYIYFDFLNTR